MIREMLDRKKGGATKGVIVAGCLAERQKELLLEEVPDVDQVVGVLEPDRDAQQALRRPALGAFDRRPVLVQALDAPQAGGAREALDSCRHRHRRRLAAARLARTTPAETGHRSERAKAKFARKGCDWIVANDVSPATGVMGGDRNTVHLLTHDGVGEIKTESFPVMTKEEVAAMLIERIVSTVTDSPA